MCAFKRTAGLFFLKRFLALCSNNKLMCFMRQIIAHARVFLKRVKHVECYYFSWFNTDVVKSHKLLLLFHSSRLTRVEKKLYSNAIVVIRGIGLKRDVFERSRFFFSYFKMLTIKRPLNFSLMITAQNDITSDQRHGVIYYLNQPTRIIFPFNFLFFPVP